MSIVYLVNILIYIKSLHHEISTALPVGCIPASLAVYFIIRILPIQWRVNSQFPYVHVLLHPNPRVSILYWWLYQVILTPFGVVTFATCYMGDVLTVRATFDERVSASVAWLLPVLIVRAMAAVCLCVCRAW